MKRTAIPSRETDTGRRPYPIKARRLL